MVYKKNIADTVCSTVVTISTTGGGGTLMGRFSCALKAVIEIKSMNKAVRVRFITLRQRKQKTIWSRHLKTREPTWHRSIN